MINVKNIILFTLFAANLIDQPAPLVKIDQGLLIGKINSDGSLHEYTGIPYATIRGRFQAPLPAPSWDGVFKAVLEHYQCPQFMEIGYIGSEDCLKINVYTPAKANKPLPVMVYIHGGAFMVGSGGKMIHGPDLLVKHDVVLVTFNYRLGPLGFLCLGIKEAPGNAGLKDQIAALRWVKKNIAAFRGDPDNVTVFGHSAGAASIALLMASNATDGLFNRAIVQSGSAIPFWTSLDGVKIASSLAKSLGYNTNDPKELYEIFSKTPVKDLVKTWTLSSAPILQMIRSDKMSAPCIEKNFKGVESVFTDLPYNIITRKPKNISVIYGVTDREGFYLIAEETEEHLKSYNKELYNFPDFEFTSEFEAETVSKKVKEYYFGNKDVTNETIANLERVYGDLFFTVPFLLESEIMTNKTDSPIYNYYFKYAGGRNLVKEMFSKNKNEPGASHGDDILYLFTSTIWPYKVTERDQKIINWMTKMWSNFAKYGDPTPSSDKDLPIKWSPSTKEGLKILNIDDDLTLGPIPNLERYKLWKDLYERHRKTKI